jgi:hypothetical protein
MTYIRLSYIVIWKYNAFNFENLKCFKKGVTYYFCYSSNDMQFPQLSKKDSNCFQKIVYLNLLLMFNILPVYWLTGEKYDYVDLANTSW